MVGTIPYLVLCCDVLLISIEHNGSIGTFLYVLAMLTDGCKQQLFLYTLGVSGSMRGFGRVAETFASARCIQEFVWFVNWFVNLYNREWRELAHGNDDAA